MKSNKYFNVLITKRSFFCFIVINKIDKLQYYRRVCKFEVFKKVLCGESLTPPPDKYATGPNKDVTDLFATLFGFQSESRKNYYHNVCVCVCYDVNEHFLNAARKTNLIIKSILPQDRDWRKRMVCCFL